jgi:hypothetical protein
VLDELIGRSLEADCAGDLADFSSKPPDLAIPST